MAKRISKSSIDWNKVSALFSKAEQGEYLKLKGKTDACLRKVVANPENPPEINFNEIKAKVLDKGAVEKLEKAYRALSVQYPGDNNLTKKINEQERDHKERGQKLVGKIREETKEANELLQKFENMIPYDQMWPEEFIKTFPDWADSPQAPSFWPYPDKKPGLSKKERHDIHKNVVLRGFN